MPLNKKVYATAKGQDLGTPLAFFEPLDQIWRFDLDVAASKSRHVVDRYFTPRQNALRRTWGMRNFCNPPYSNQLPFFKRAVNQAVKRDAASMFLIPARTDSKLFQSLLTHQIKFWECQQWCSRIWFVPGRLQFVGADGPAPFPSALVLISRPLGFADEIEKTDALIKALRKEDVL